MKKGESFFLKLAVSTLTLFMVLASKAETPSASEENKPAVSPPAVAAAAIASMPPSSTKQVVFVGPYLPSREMLIELGYLNSEEKSLDAYNRALSLWGTVSVEGIPMGATNFRGETVVIPMGTYPLPIFERSQVSVPGGGGKKVIGFAKRGSSGAQGVQLLPVAELPEYWYDPDNLPEGVKSDIDGVPYSILRKDPAGPKRQKKFKVRGYEVLQEHLWNVFHLGYEKPEHQNIFALILYYEAQENKISMSDLATSAAIQGHYGHLGALISLRNQTKEGDQQVSNLNAGGSIQEFMNTSQLESRNFPVNYHNWGIQSTNGYMPLIIGIQYLGADSPGITNTQLVRYARELSETRGGAEFSTISYDRDPLGQNTLKKILEFYYLYMTLPKRDFINVIKKKNLNQFYCAEGMQHVATTLALNLPSNPEGFKEVYGDERGLELWKATQKRWKEEHKLKDGLGKVADKLPMIPTDSFVPLWKLAGIRAERDKGILQNPKVKNDSLLFPIHPLNTFDLIRNFSMNFLSFLHVDTNVAVQAFLSFADEVQGRTDMEHTEYLAAIEPVIKAVYKYGLALQVLKERIKINQLRINQSDVSQGITKGLLKALAKAYSDAYKSEESAATRPIMEQLAQFVKIGEDYSFGPELTAEVTALVEAFSNETQLDELETMVRDRFLAENRTIFKEAAAKINMKYNYKQQLKEGVSETELKVERYSPPAALAMLLKGHNYSSVVDNPVMHYIDFIPLGIAAPARDLTFSAGAAKMGYLPIEIGTGKSLEKVKSKSKKGIDDLAISCRLAID